MDYGIFNMRSDVNACDCTRGCTGTRKRVCTESWLWEKNPLPHRGIEPASAAWWSDARPMSYIPSPLSLRTQTDLGTRIFVTHSTANETRRYQWKWRRCCLSQAATKRLSDVMIDRVSLPLNCLARLATDSTFTSFKSMRRVRNGPPALFFFFSLLILSFSCMH